jgi:hypothetical protein
MLGLAPLSTVPLSDLPSTGLVTRGSASFRFTTSGQGRADIAGHGTAVFYFTGLGHEVADETGSGTSVFMMAASGQGLADIAGHGLAAFVMTTIGQGKATSPGTTDGHASFSFHAGGIALISPGSGSARFSFRATGESIGGPVPIDVPLDRPDNRFRVIDLRPDQPGVNVSLRLDQTATLILRPDAGRTESL